MEREDPSEQPCREGETKEPFVKPGTPGPGQYFVRLTSGFNLIATIRPYLKFLGVFAHMFGTFGVTAEVSATSEYACESMFFGGEEGEVYNWLHGDTNTHESWYLISVRTGAPSLTSNTFNSSQLKAFPFLLERDTLVKKIGFVLSSNDRLPGVTEGRLGIYAAKSDIDSYPGALVADCAIIDLGMMNLDDPGTPTLKFQNVNMTLPAGIYWGIFVINSSSTTLGFEGYNTTDLTNYGTILIGIDEDFNYFWSLATTISNPTYPDPLPDPFPVGATLGTERGPALGLLYG